MTLRRDWVDAREKIDGQPCRVCGQTWGVEAAHIAQRKHDKRERGATVVRVEPAGVVPLCGPATTSSTCHGQFDAGTLDLLPYLSLDEQLEAVRALGGIEAARRRIMGAQAWRAAA
jgi:hypothetical protein